MASGKIQTGGYKIISLGEVSDLNTIQTTMGTIAVASYKGTASNRPVYGSGFCITELAVDNVLYGKQVAFSDVGMFTRQYSNGSFGNWYRADAVPNNLNASYSNVDMATTLTYTGKTITIPAYSAFSVTVRCTYGESKPEQVTINSDAEHSAWNLASGSYAGVCACCTWSAVNNNSAALTMYIWAKYANAGKNNIIVDGFSIPFK